jgi:histone deacetylase 11
MNIPLLACYFLSTDYPTAEFQHVHKHNAVQEYRIQTSQKLPIIYHEKYNFLPEGSWFSYLRPLIRSVHPFDPCKYRDIFSYLRNIGLQQWYEPDITGIDQQLTRVHDATYLNNLSNPKTISQIIDLDDALTYIPGQKRLALFLQKNLIEPMKYATSGTILGAQLARKEGWAINLGGGFHHAQRDAGQGGCAFADIPLAIEMLRATPENKNINVLIIDLDAHQGNGLESLAHNKPYVYIFDMFNGNVDPRDPELLEEIRSTSKNVWAVDLNGGELTPPSLFGITLPDLFERCVGRNINTTAYLNCLQQEFPQAYLACVTYFGSKKPDLIIYNAGTDILDDDPWGCLNIDETGIIRRDQFVFEQARDYAIPILMVLSGGYSQKSSHAIGRSIQNLFAQGLIQYISQK